MKRIIWSAAIGAALTAALATTAVASASGTGPFAFGGGSGAKNGAAGQASAPDQATVASFGSLAQAVLEQRTSALVDPSAQGAHSTHSREAHTFGDSKFSLASGVTRTQSTDVTTLQKRRARLKAAGEVYTAGNTAVSVTRVQMHGKNHATVLLTETTSLTYKKVHGGEPPSTGFQAQHEATFVADAHGRWQLTGMTDVNQGGFPQVNQVTSQVSKSPRTAQTAPEATPASTAWPAASSPKPAQANGYNYSAMAAYATKYWNHYNTAYRQFNGAGGDCTNFISQSLKAGGWQNASGWASDYDHTWWYSATNPATQSYSWNGVNEWSWFAEASGRVKNLADVYQLGVGDILQMDFDGDGSKDHSMIVTYRSASGMPYVTYHSTNTLNRSVASLVASFPDAVYYAYRT